jgi:hypothetical protein
MVGCWDFFYQAVPNADGTDLSEDGVVRKLTFMACKMWLAQLLATFVTVGALPSAMADRARLSPAEAINHVGQMATVCGCMASAKYATNANRQPTLLNLEKPYPNQVFTAVIWGSDRAAFSYAPESLADHRICVTGTIQQYRGKAEIIVSGPNQIQKRMIV